jgi:hypothetical protein
MCITGPQVYNGQHQNVSDHLQMHLGQGKMGSSRKKEASNTFVQHMIGSQESLPI